MGQVTDIRIKKTLCVLTVSHYQHDLLQDWCARWGERVVCEIMPPEQDGLPDILEFWDVSGPQKAFAELPDELFATNYRAILGNRAIR